MAEKLIKLNLTRRQARALMTILFRVGGPPEDARGEVDKIADQIRKQGVEYGSYFKTRVDRGGFYFNR